jgi:tetratricopeptide (TPR) repeat protein
VDVGTVFISYRREPDIWPARMIRNYLVAHSWDVFLDTESIDSGRFETVILNEIGAREHFLVIVSAAWLASASEPASWCRRELERAIEFKKNIVPVLINGIAFASEEYNRPALAKLAQLNSLALYADYFDEGMLRLRERFLTQPSLHEIEHRTAEEHFQQGQGFLAASRYEEAIRAFDAAARLKPEMPELFNNRGIAKYTIGDDHGALADFDRAIALEPDGHEAHGNRFNVLQKMGRTQEALDSLSRSRGRIPRRHQLE